MEEELETLKKERIVEVLSQAKEKILIDQAGDSDKMEAIIHLLEVAKDLAKSL